jgi:hypothetical protein
MWSREQFRRPYVVPVLLPGKVQSTAMSDFFVVVHGGVELG